MTVQVHGREIFNDSDINNPDIDGGTIDNTPIGGATPSTSAFTQSNLSKGSDVASANALTLGSDGNYFDITGNTAILSIGTLGIGTVVLLHFDGILTLTHHAADLIIPGGANITTAAGDEAMFVEYASGDWQCVAYTKASGAAVAANIADDTSPQLGGILDSNSKQIRWSKGLDVASANGLTLGDDGNYFDITGVTAITSIATKGIGTVVILHFDGILTLTHNAADLILPGGANITTAAGDDAMFVEYASGDWRCVTYMKASGAAVITDVSDDTTPQLGGDLDLTDYEILADTTPDTNITASGIKGVFTNGNAVAVAFGDICYMAADGHLEFADASAITTMPGLYMALGTIAAAASGEWLIMGIARNDAWAWTIGAGTLGLIYISITGTTGNTLTQTAPAVAGNQVQIVGHAISATVMMFNPDHTYVEVA